MPLPGAEVVTPTGCGCAPSVADDHRGQVRIGTVLVSTVEPEEGRMATVTTDVVVECESSATNGAISRVRFTFGGVE